MVSALLFFFLGGGIGLKSGVRSFFGGGLKNFWGGFPVTPTKGCPQEHKLMVTPVITPSGALDCIGNQGQAPPDINVKRTVAKGYLLYGLATGIH